MHPRESHMPGLRKHCQYLTAKQCSRRRMPDTVRYVRAQNGLWCLQDAALAGTAKSGHGHKAL